MAELYTGEMYFGTHENLEHLALIEKECGPFPLWMAEQSAPFKKYFDFEKSESEVKKRGFRLKWKELEKKTQRIRNIEEMLTLDVN